MNLLLLTYQGDLAGSTYSISYLAKGLAQRGHTVVVGCRTESLLYRLLANTAVIRYPMTFKGRTDSVNMRQIEQCVNKHNIQLINAQSSYDRYTAALSIWRYKLNCKLVHTRRQISASMGGRLQSWFYQKTTAAMVAVSQQIKESLVSKGIAAEHIKVIENGTPPEKYQNPLPEVQQELVQRFGLTNNLPLLGCVSRPKQQEQLLEALKQVEQPVQLLLAGISAEARYTEIADQLQKQHRIIFAGDLKQQEVLELYRIMQLKVLPSVTEGLSQSLLEAMALGVPVIATAAAGNLALVESGQNGFLFPEGNIALLASQIETLLKDKELHQKFVLAGKKTALEDFSIERTVSRYEDFFMSLIDIRI